MNMMASEAQLADVTVAGLLGPLQSAALEAGRAIMHHYENGCAVFDKKDLTPVTEADRNAEAIILAALADHAPNIPIVAEEEAAAGRIPTILGDRFFLIDPLDGTREFLLRNGDFTVNIALIEKGVPVFGLVYAPARHLLFIGSSQGAEEIETCADHKREQQRPIKVRVAPSEPIALCSRSHATAATEQFLQKNRIRHSVSVGSSLKFCMIARGEADIYPRFGPTMEWDTAAGDAVLRAAGGMTVTPDGLPLLYGQRADGTISGFANSDFIALGGGNWPAFTLLDY